jgi:anti-anti-sigma factor
MRLKVIRADESLKHVALLGRLDIQGVNDIQYEFQQETTVAPRPTVVDLSKVTYIASLGIGMLVSAAKYMERSGAKMVLLRPSALVGKALEASGLGHVMPIVEEEGAALELLR